MKFLYAAYFATWIIHIGYIAILLRGIARLRAESAELSGGNPERRK
jgi:hypothetical protein